MTTGPQRPAPRTPRAKRADDPPGLPLGPDSLTWKLFGDARGLIIVGRTGVLQTMHPTISQALVDHSDYFENPLNRILRSSGPILGVVYGREPERTGAKVRDWHKPIKGTRPDGKSYRALDADAYFWAHATFFESQIARMKFFGQPLSYDEKRQLWLEAITWYRRYGMSMKIVPRSYDAFREYWQGMLDEVLEATPVAASAIVRSDLPSPFPSIPGPAWAAIGPVVARSGPWLTRGTLPPRAQEILGIRWTAADEAALRSLRLSVRMSWPVLPPQVTRLGVSRVIAREKKQQQRQPVAA